MGAPAARRRLAKVWRRSYRRNAGSLAFLSIRRKTLPATHLSWTGP
jgi:hypothetical protein